jgi:hypothetical protein
MLVLSDLLRIFVAVSHDFGLFDMKNLSSKFFDLGTENPLGRGTLANLRPTL